MKPTIQCLYDSYVYENAYFNLYIGSNAEALHVAHHKSHKNEINSRIMVSGSGKTTLLDVIACRTEGGLISGDVYLNNVVRTSNMVRGCSAYVRQDDRLLPHLTVKETLMFVAQLKLPTTFNSRDIQKRVSLETEKAIRKGL